MCSLPSLFDGSDRVFDISDSTVDWVGRVFSQGNHRVRHGDSLGLWVSV